MSREDLTRVTDYLDGDDSQKTMTAGMAPDARGRLSAVPAPAARPERKKSSCIPNTSIPVRSAQRRGLPGRLTVPVPRRRLVGHAAGQTAQPATTPPSHDPPPSPVCPLLYQDFGEPAPPRYGGGRSLGFCSMFRLIRGSQTWDVVGAITGPGEVVNADSGGASVVVRSGPGGGSPTTPGGPYAGSAPVREFDVKYRGLIHSTST